jgi:stress-induced morphogen
MMFRFLAPITLLGSPMHSLQLTRAVLSSPPRCGSLALFATAKSVKFRGPMQEFVEKTLETKFSPSYLEVINESHGKKSDESHFKVVVVSEIFEKKSLLQRHRLVNGALVEKSNSDGVLPFHSLTIVAKTPQQWSEDSAVPKSPQCAGGDGRGALK